jgi:hypothetical protein
MVRHPLPVVLKNGAEVTTFIDGALPLDSCPPPKGNLPAGQIASQVN